jgi:N-acetylmuramoyl-L-alanine amidase
MAKKVIYLDAGHAKVTAGKRSPDSSLLEWEFNNDMQLRLKPRLEDHGFEVVLVNPTPGTGSEVGLTTRATTANNHWTKNNKPDAIYVSLHANAAGNDWSTASGTETYVAKNASSASKTCAKLVNDQIVADLGTKNRGVKTENFTVIYKASMPSILIEYGFYSSKTEVEMLKSSTKRDLMVEATVKALCKHFSVTYQTKTSSATTAATNPSKTFSKGSYNGKVKVTATTLNVRKGRGSSYAKIGTLSKGQIVEVWTIDVASDGELWGSFRYDADNIGFIHMGYVTPC